MAVDDILKNFAAFVDGRGYVGEVTQYTPPPLTQAMEALRGGGMHGPAGVPMGLDGLLTTSFVMTKYSRHVLTLWGVTQGGVVPFTVRGALEAFDGTVTAVAHIMRGRVSGIDKGTWAPGTLAPMTVTMTLDYYKETRGDEVITEIDIINMIHIVNGVDQLAAQRAALGI